MRGRPAQTKLANRELEASPAACHAAKCAVLAFSRSFLTHAVLAPANNFASRFSKRCFVSELIPPTERTRVVREPHRGSHDREAIYKILDEGIVCHVGFSADGQPYVIPTMFARVGDAIYFHGRCS